MQAADFFLVFTQPLDQAGIRYMVSGSVASIVYGEPRLTNVVDLVVVLNDSLIQQLATLFPADRFYCPPPEIVSIESKPTRRGHFNIIHHDTGLKADLYLAGNEPLQAWGLAHRQRVEVGNGQAIWIAPIEYVILKNWSTSAKAVPKSTCWIFAACWPSPAMKSIPRFWMPRLPNCT